MADVTRTPRARQDLIEHATYLYLNEPGSDVSERFLSATETAFARLAEMPGLGTRLTTESPRLTGLRRWPVPGFRNHLIFYRETETGIDVVRVLHGARDWDAMLQEEETEED